MRRATGIGDRKTEPKRGTHPALRLRLAHSRDSPQNVQEHAAAPASTERKLDAGDTCPSDKPENTTQMQMSTHVSTIPHPVMSHVRPYSCHRGRSVQKSTQSANTYQCWCVPEIAFGQQKGDRSASSSLLCTLRCTYLAHRSTTKREIRPNKMFVNIYELISYRTSIYLIYSSALAPPHPMRPYPSLVALAWPHLYSILDPNAH